MIRSMLILSFLALGTWFAAPAGAEDKPAADKETKLTGTLVCAKCKLKDPTVKKCTNALLVQEGEKTVTYLLEDKGNGESYHEELCGGGELKDVAVTGKIAEKDGKKWIKASAVAVKK